MLAKQAKRPVHYVILQPPTLLKNGSKYHALELSKNRKSLKTFLFIHCHRDQTVLTVQSAQIVIGVDEEQLVD